MYHLSHKSANVEILRPVALKDGGQDLKSTFSSYDQKATITFQHSLQLCNPKLQVQRSNELSLSNVHPKLYLTSCIDTLCFIRLTIVSFSTSTSPFVVPTFLIAIVPH